MLGKRGYLVSPKLWISFYMEALVRTKGLGQGVSAIIGSFLYPGCLSLQLCLVNSYLLLCVSTQHRAA